MENIISLQDVKKSYYLSDGTEIPVLKGITMDVKKGEFIALMGESGSGKSTLLNIIGFLHSMTEGTYIFENEDISSFLGDEDILAFIRNRKIGFIFQQYFLLPRLTAIENVALPAVYKGVPYKERLEKAKFYLKQVGLADKLYNKPSELSGGQQQRVAIARALINEPELILADEPTGALDTQTTIEIMNLLKNLHNQGKTIIMVTHSIEVAKYASRVVFLKDGKIADENYKI